MVWYEDAASTSCRLLFIKAMCIKLCILRLHFNLFYWQLSFQAHELISLLPAHLAERWLKYGGGLLSNAANK